MNPPDRPTHRHRHRGAGSVAFPAGRSTRGRGGVADVAAAAEPAGVTR